MIDFNDEWKRLQKTRAPLKDSSHWTKKSARYDTKDAHNPYAEQFLALADVQPGETVFDMGCGTGALAVPLALEGHEVYAADFSEGMLAKLAENMVERGASSITPLRLSWEDDWEAHGIERHMADVAFASRSIAVADLASALDKLTSVARRRCCITMTTNASPSIDPHILSAIGAPAPPTRDFLYAFGILTQKGYEPTVNYIRSTRKDTFDSHAEALEDFSRMIDLAHPSLPPERRRIAIENLDSWLSAHIVDNPDAGKPDKKGVPEGILCLDVLRVVSWGFIAWDTQNESPYDL